jgi:hypothetical protein
MEGPIRPTNIEALIEGGVSGQVAAGNYSVRIHGDHGAVVSLLPANRQPPSPARSLAELTADAEARSAPGEAVVSPGVLDQLTAEERRVVAILAGADGAPVGIDPLRETAGPDADRILGKLRELQVVQAHGPRHTLRVELGEAVRQAWQVDLWQEKLWERLTAWAERHPGRIHEEAASLRQAVDSAAAAERWETVRRLGRAIEGPLAVAGLWGAWGQVIERVLAASERLRNVPSHAWALHQRGSRALCLGDLQAAREDLAQALQIRESIGDFAGAAVTRHNLGLLLAPPPPPQSLPAGTTSAPHSFQSLLAWLLVPALLILVGLVVGGRTLLSRPSASDPEPAAETQVFTEESDPGEEPVPQTTVEEEPVDPLTTSASGEVPETTDLSVVEIPVDLPAEEEVPVGTIEPVPADTTEPEPDAANSAGCCVNGVFQVDMAASECSSLEGTSMTAAEAATLCEPLDQSAQGWCCIDQEVFPSTADYCTRNGGGFGRNARQARRRCPTPEGEEP